MRYPDVAADLINGLLYGGKRAVSAEEHVEMITAMVDAAVKNLYLTLQKACEALGTTLEEYGQAKAALGK